MLHLLTRCAQDIPYNLYSTQEPYYKEAFTLALAKALDIPIVRCVCSELLGKRALCFLSFAPAFRHRLSCSLAPPAAAWM